MRPEAGGKKVGQILRRIWSPPLLRLLKRHPEEITHRTKGFSIQREEDRERVANLGRAFIGGFNAMLVRSSLQDVADEGAALNPHDRPFFFEGAAMGYLPRGYASPEFRPKNAEADLEGMCTQFRYLYYVGLGFWYAVRHPRNPSALEELRPHLSPIYFPLCYDGYGFKIGLFDFPKNRRARRVLLRCPPEHLSAIHQGFGRSLHFVYMDDEESFRQERDAQSGAHREDIEFGRSLAVAFTGLYRPLSIIRHLTAAEDDRDLWVRLAGITWALTAREMNDPEYFRICIGGVDTQWRDLLVRLPVLCREALSKSRGYLEWQARTKSAAAEALSTLRLVAAKASAFQIPGAI